MRKELKGALAILQGKKRNTLEYDWHCLLGILLCNRIGVPFYRMAKQTDSQLPKQVERILDSLQLQQCHRNKIMEEWISDLAYEFDAAGIMIAFLKGSVLSFCPIGDKYLYDKGERSSNDVDILVSPDDLGMVDRVLASFGFVQGRWDETKKTLVPFERREIIYRRMTRGETAPYLIETHLEDMPFLELDVNYSLGYLPSGDRNLVNDMLIDCKRYQFHAGGTIPSFTEEKFLLHLIMHLYKEATLFWMVARHKDSQLYKYLDIYRLLQSGIIDKKKFLDLVERVGLQEQVFYVLHFCNLLFPCQIAQDLLCHLSLADLSKLDFVYDTESKTDFYWTRGIEDRVGIYERKRYLRKM